MAPQTSLKKAGNRVNIISLIKGEMIEDNGEDFCSYFYAKNKGYVGVFDGCGGIGSKRYPECGNKTGAFLSSRITAKTTLDWFKSGAPKFAVSDGESLKNAVLQNLTDYKEKTSSAPGFALKGSLSKTLPTTASLAAFDITNPDYMLCSVLWAGDSRVFALDRHGICQLTRDDIEGEQDAFSNLTNDSKLENVINADFPFKINAKLYKLRYPCLLLTSTDGAFAYYPTPMEFEYSILNTLSESDSVEEWEAALDREISSVASDDYTLMFAVFGFGDFAEVKRFYADRRAALYENYIKDIHESRKSGRELDIDSLWETYKNGYYRG